jgi:DNA-binding NtrC family response regulator
MAEETREDKRSRVLVVEDEEIIRDILLKTLDEEGYKVDAVESGEEALKALDGQLYDIVLLDLNLPGMHGLNVLAAAPAVQTDAQFIVMTAFGTVDTAVEAMKLGAYDYINKPFRTEELLLSLRRAREEADLRREVAQLRRKAGEGMKSKIVGRTAPMQRLFDMIERVAPTRATVLVSGETGTGKELVARAIHDLSDRARRPFVAVNCSALPESLLESELFGHMKGSFTGAIQNKRGLFEEASGGTLFLDEISTVSSAIQVKLLRVLQERKIKRVGGREMVPVDFRLVAATNLDLAKLVEQDEFREDLFYRLNVFPILVPPLRERREDIPLLANHFRLRFAEENGIEPPDLPPETLSRMMAYEWPGNVRELENFVERAVIMHAGAKTIPFDPPQGLGRRPERELLTRARDEQWDLERLEREYILEILEETHWHQGEASEILGINRRTLYRKLRKYREDGLLPEARMSGVGEDEED